MNAALTLVTFGMGSRRWQLAARRLERQGHRSGWFAQVEVWDAARLRRNLPGFWLKHRAFIESQSRGWGYWVWRPAIIQWHLQHAYEGDVFVFLDAGCELNTSAAASKTLEDYIGHARSQGLGAMQIDEPTTRWSKVDLLRSVQVEGHTPLPKLVEPGVLLAARSSAAWDVVNTWADWCTRNAYHFVDDSPSTSPESADFHNHRHDQSILTCVLPSSMTMPHASYFPGQWRTAGATAPFWACRNSLPVLVEQATITSASVRWIRRAHHLARA